MRYGEKNIRDGRIEYFRNFSRKNCTSCLPHHPISFRNFGKNNCAFLFKKKKKKKKIQSETESNPGVGVGVGIRSNDAVQAGLRWKKPDTWADQFKHWIVQRKKKKKNRGTNERTRNKGNESSNNVNVVQVFSWNMEYNSI